MKSVSSFGRQKALSALFFSSLLACSSADSAPPAAAPSPAGGDAGTSEPEPVTEADAAPPTTACAAPPRASKCKNEGSWVRGIAQFDPAHFAAGVKPVLRVSLRHSFVLVSGEDKIGGRLHAFQSFPIKDVASGKVAFAIDMCVMGTAMWSDENDPFNVILHIDENENNNLDNATSNSEANTIATPDPGELVKVVRAEISCNAPSPCLDAVLDCKDGASCTTIEPIKSCKKKTPGCKSDDSFCK